MRCKFKLFAAISFALIPASVSAGTADVTKANVTCQSNSTCQFTVTLRHTDKGWDHYADRWEVLSLEGEVLGTRILYHPHVNEQPLYAVAGWRSHSNVNKTGSHPRPRLSPRLWW